MRKSTAKAWWSEPRSSEFLEEFRVDSPVVSWSHWYVVCCVIPLTSFERKISVFLFILQVVQWKRKWVCLEHKSKDVTLTPVKETQLNLYECSLQSLLMHATKKTSIRQIALLIVDLPYETVPLLLFSILTTTLKPHNRRDRYVIKYWEIRKGFNKTDSTRMWKDWSESKQHVSWDRRVPRMPRSTILLDSTPQTQRRSWRTSKSQ